MQPASFNALLKILEEPPLDSYIILLTSYIDQILPTIVSRCNKINFDYISELEIFKFLIEVQHKDENEAKKIATLSMGSISKALFLLKNSLINKNEDLIRIFTKNFSSYAEFLEILKRLEAESADQKDENLIFHQILMWYRDIYLLKEKVNEKHLFYIDEKEKLKSQKEQKIPSLEKIYSYVEEAKLGLDRNIKLTTCLEVLFSKLIF